MAAEEITDPAVAERNSRRLVARIVSKSGHYGQGPTAQLMGRRLFVPQRHHWIDRCGAPGRQVSGQHRNQREKRADASERQWI
jgi:hypothetical protein